MNMKEKKTSWGNVAKWYDEVVEGNRENYHRAVILPNLARLLDIKRGDKILDIACGQGFFTGIFAKNGAEAVGADIAEELIEIAKKKFPAIPFHVTPADALSFAKDGSFDKAVIVLALQNIENAYGVIEEASRVLKTGGRLVVILNHPAFRVPKASDWGWDEKEKIQYRRIDKYLFESRVKIQMHPGADPDEVTISFHRPLQFYFKGFNKSGLAVTGLEEWISHKKSALGPRAEMENKARKEIPLFLMLEAVKL